MLPLQDELISLEKRLLAPETRHTYEVLARLIHPDFVEYGKTGNIYDKAAVVEGLLQHPAERAAPPVARDFNARLLAEGLGQVTYVTESSLEGGEIVQVLRSSLWKQEAAGWQMIFHQGTVQRT